LNLSEPLNFALNAVRKAGKLTKQIQTELAGDHLTKEDRSPVTIADFAAQAIVSKMLMETFPDAALVGEEDAGVLRNESGKEILDKITQYVSLVIPEAVPESVVEWIDRGNAEAEGKFWTLDPIDGTKGYMRGEQFAVALAFIENGEVQLGALACPNLGAGCVLDSNEGVITLAEKGKGAAWTLLEDGGDFMPLHASPQNDITQARLMRSVESGHTNTGKIGELIEQLHIAGEPVCLDSQAKYAVLAAGNGEILLRLLSPKQPDYKEKIWDQAAGLIVLEEAGGQITDLSGAPLDFAQGSTLANNSGVCATNRILHTTIVNALRA
jgi:3'(2'), 5'-bisphosphate nucleotidase